MNNEQEEYRKTLEEVRDAASKEQSLVDTKIIKGDHKFNSDRAKWGEWS